ncbi:P-loop containing nucleoside triphosphate hydrolase protein [Sistotremastrum suecicum HHB10207 ss-3]|uniref:DNA 3'-5' helicase n=1 Tax=Sistotremastrum suecicum HHB10207 ss-3 TaxID=1314776 RepID=A0A165YCW9_9AGAM|nr:P-loop containing nucleoside triphosphate hydrolase protein [Sistotremastrum suecicum HHB10207 ss-3]
MNDTLSAVLKTLNERQYQAVTHNPEIPLQILAGPGSGKTKVLTSRVAYLVQEHKLRPSDICAVTFTNKAASEMRERLNLLIGEEQTKKLRLGTFHALCARFLRQWGKTIGLTDRFTICDADESKKIITNLLKAYDGQLKARRLTLQPGEVLSSISNAKAKGLSSADLFAQAENDIHQIIAELYASYTEALKKMNALDFDDLLVYGVRLYDKEPTLAAWCQHVLVDEFQDTNSMQYRLMLQLAAIHRCVSVVGDPDQSIYGWRAADVGNISAMQKNFTDCKQIMLEHNYRSTGAILGASIAIVSQDTSRIQKSLVTDHAQGTKPALLTFAIEQTEANFIAKEIKRLVACSGGMLTWKDFAILLRFNALSRTLEAALQKESIPNRVLAGHKFFERLEIKDILAYLQLIDNPNYVPAFSRAINVPSRSIGEKTIAAVLEAAASREKSPMELLEGIYEGRYPDVKPAVKGKIREFIPLHQQLRTMATEGGAVPDLIRHIITATRYEDHLRKTQPDWDTRWENVQELINYAQQFDQDPEDIVELPSVEGEDGAQETPLRLFLQASMLSTDTESDDDRNKDTNKVVLSTCHAAKGLEWPVVFVPGVEQGIFPFYRNDDVAEERRLLYVACTRAQAFLYVSYCSKRMTAGEIKDRTISDFISKIPADQKKVFDKAAPIVGPKCIEEVAKVLRRDPPDTDIVEKATKEFGSFAPPRENLLDPNANMYKNTIRGPGSHLAFSSSQPATFQPARMAGIASIANPYPTPSSSQPPPPSQSQIQPQTPHPLMAWASNKPKSSSGPKKFRPMPSSSQPPAGATATLSTFQSTSIDSLKAMKNLGAAETAGSPDMVALGRGAGTKRLGMGFSSGGYKPPSKRAKQE